MISGSLSSPGPSLTRKRTRITPGEVGRQDWSKGCRLAPQASLTSASQARATKPILGQSAAPQGLSLQREEPENNQNEPSPSAKQHKKAKKRKSLGTPVLPVVASRWSAPQ